MPVFRFLLVGGPDPQLLKSGCGRSVPRRRERNAEQRHAEKAGRVVAPTNALGGGAAAGGFFDGRRTPGAARFSAARAAGGATVD